MQDMDDHDPPADDDAAAAFLSSLDDIVHSQLPPASENEANQAAADVELVGVSINVIWDAIDGNREVQNSEGVGGDDQTFNDFVADVAASDVVVVPPLLNAQFVDPNAPFDEIFGAHVRGDGQTSNDFVADVAANNAVVVPPLLNAQFVDPNAPFDEIFGAHERGDGQTFNDFVADVTASDAVVVHPLLNAQFVDPNAPFDEIFGAHVREDGQTSNAFVAAAAATDALVVLPLPNAQFVDPIPPVDEIFGAYVRGRARLPFIPPNEAPGPLNDNFPIPRIMPSALHFRESIAKIQEAVLTSDNQQLINNHLEVMRVSFESLAQNTANGGMRYPREREELSDYLGYTAAQVRKDHAQITPRVFNQRVAAKFGVWPPSGNATTMPVLVYYPDGFHTYMFCPRGISFVEFCEIVGLVCGISIGNFSLWYSNRFEYIPLQDQATWEACNAFYDDSRLVRLQLLVAAN